MRLVDADALFEHKVTGEIGNLSGDFVPGFVIDRTPTIDAVEVVRCRYCKKYHKESYIDYAWCSKWRDVRAKDDFCNYGERREPDGE